jgi:diguanylate cyclase (GGDEF)-like protein/PAS domain S-box-containing protein
MSRSITRPWVPFALFGTGLGGVYILDPPAPLLFALTLLSAGALFLWDRGAWNYLQRILPEQHGTNLVAQIAENSFDGILTVAQDGKIQDFNESATTLFGYSCCEAQGIPAAHLIRPVGQNRAPDLLNPTGTITEATGVRKDGNLMPLEIAVNELGPDDRDTRVVIIRDITERKERERSLRYKATHDSLTGLPDESMLQRDLDRILKRYEKDGRGAAFMMLDIDGFKQITDLLGHEIGNSLLREIAMRLTAILRPMDSLARLSGDRFAIMLPECNLGRAESVAKRLVISLSEPFETKGMALTVEAKIGIATAPEHGRKIQDLLKMADTAMYTAKRVGAATAVYKDDDDQISVRNLTLNGALLDAIKTDALQLYFQPKVDSLTGRIVSMEALVRWIHPELGMVPPDDFIPLAEQTGIIRQLTHWVLDKAIAQGVAWRSQGHLISLSVNVSARNLMEEDLPWHVNRMLRHHGLEPEHLTLEITESLIMEDPKRSMRVLTRLASMGTRISIDDFGTGHSSLAYLKKLPAREIKIDKSFVMEMDQDRADHTIVRSTIEMAHRLGLQVVAEGVENEGVWRMLTDAGCNVGQGYLFSRPLPADEISTILESQPWLRPSLDLDMDKEVS